MSSSESDALLQTRRKPNGPSWFAALSVGVVGVVAITSGAKSGFKAYQSRSSSKQLGEWEDRAVALHNDATKCNSCAVVIPSDKLTGKGFGSAIDEHDCVVRFNTHDPSDAPAEDWGTKDDIRVVNAYQVDALQQEGGSCIDPKHPTCRRVIITWETGGVDGFLGDHENAELLPQMDAEYYPNYDGKPDVHDTLRNFANENGLGVPMYGSSAYCAISVMRHPDVCGEKMTIFGIPASMEVETEGYIDPHGPANAAHCYSTEHEYFRKTAGSEGWENVVVQDMGDAPVTEEKPAETEEVAPAEEVAEEARAEEAALAEEEEATSDEATVGKEEAPRRRRDETVSRAAAAVSRADTAMAVAREMFKKLGL